MDLEPDWEFVADRVMGGVSRGGVSRETVAGRKAVRLTGKVSLENDGGFLQMAFDVPQDTRAAMAAAKGLEFDVIGNDETYDVRLRTTALTRPWQSFRAEFAAVPQWQTIRIPFLNFRPNKTDRAFDPGAVRRIGFVAVGRAFDVDISIARIALFA